MAVCGIKYCLNNRNYKNLRCTYNQKLQIQKYFVKTITNILNVLNLWRMGNITLKGKIKIIKTIFKRVN